jgi:hypothetical protein
MKYREALENIARCSNYTPNKKTAKKKCSTSKHKCQKSKRTISRIYIPAGSTFNYLNLIEATTPSGISLIVRLPSLGGSTAGIPGNIGLSEVLDVFKAAGVTVEIEK